MRAMRIRTTLVAALLSMAVVMTLVFLILVRLTVARQIQNDLATDLQRSEFTYHNLEIQRRLMLFRTASLIADLPSLKALMTAPDASTVIDGGAQFWRISGSNLFILSDQAGHMVSSYNTGAPLSADDLRTQSTQFAQQSDTFGYIHTQGRLFEVLSTPIQFGNENNALPLGYVTIGYEIDQSLAREIQQVADAQIVFLSGDSVIASTLRPDVLSSVPHHIPFNTPSNALWTLGGERFVASSIPLETQTPTQPQPVLLVLKSYDKAAKSLHNLNLGIAWIALLGLLTGVFLAVSMAHRITTPIESLVVATSSVGSDAFHYPAHDTGAQEVRELSRAFRDMQQRVRQTQQDLLKAERMATIGNMASSVSHDLRHYLTSIYANAEFLCTPGLPLHEQEAMLAEVRTAVFGMTDLLDSLLLFGRTSLSLHVQHDSLTSVAERTVARVRMHPDARTIAITTSVPPDLDADFDAQELGRAIYNLLLNACHAAKRGPSLQRVSLRLVTDEDTIRIYVADTGPGVPDSIRQTLFEPFVSAGKENGTGLGLALALRIAQAHHGTLELVTSTPGNTVFCLSFPASLTTDDTTAPQHLPSESIA